MSLPEACWWQELSVEPHARVGIGAARLRVGVVCLEGRLPSMKDPSSASEPLETNARGKAVAWKTEGFWKTDYLFSDPGSPKIPRKFEEPRVKFLKLKLSARLCIFGMGARRCCPGTSEQKHGSSPRCHWDWGLNMP